MNGKIRKMAIWSRFPNTVREMRRRLMMKSGMREERDYPIEMRRLLYLAWSKR